MKKICFVITSITDNGVSRVLTILLEKIIKTDFEVKVLFTRNREQAYSINESIGIINSERKEWSGISGKIKNIISIRRIIKKEKFDVVISLGNYASMYMLLGCVGIKIKKIISERNDPTKEPDKKYYRGLRDIIYRTADIIICQTEDAAKYYKNIIKRRVIIPNPIKENLPISDRNNREKIIVNYCRLNNQKNLPLLIDAFYRLHNDYPEYSLKIYGEGELEQFLKEYINKKGLEDYVEINKFSLNIHEMIKNYAMFVSSSNYEGMSNSMLESLAIGLPTIVTDCPVGGARMVIDSYKNGIIVPINDCDSLYLAMKFIVENPKRAEEMAEKAKEIRNILSAEKIYRKWIEIIK